MDLVNSVDFLFSIQTFFLLSVLENKTFKSLKSLIRLSIVGTLFAIGVLVWIYFHENKTFQDGDRKLEQFSGFFSSICQVLIFIFTVIYRKKESTFYQELVQVDKILTTYGSLEETYHQFSNATKPIVLPIVGYAILEYALIKMVDMPITFEELTQTTVFIYLQCSLFIYTCVFFFNIKLLRDRFRFIKDMTSSCIKMEEFEDLEKAHKSLIGLMDGIDDGMGVKLGFVLISNFMAAVINSYSVFVSFIEKSYQPYTIYSIFGIIFPNIIMLFMSFLSGEWISTDVKDSLHALTNVPIHTEEAVAVKRKLHLKMKALSFGISGGKVIPLNLGVLFAGFNILATYFVILLQFRTLTDTSLLQQTP